MISHISLVVVLLQYCACVLYVDAMAGELTHTCRYIGSHTLCSPNSRCVDKCMRKLHSGNVRSFVYITLCNVQQEKACGWCLR